MSTDVQYKDLRSAVVSMDNAVNESRAYEISANVSVQQGDKVGTIDAGVVRNLGETTANVATFSAWSDTNKNYNFVGECDECAVIEAIQVFIADVKAKVAEGGLI